MTHRPRSRRNTLACLAISAVLLAILTAGRAWAGPADSLSLTPDRRRITDEAIARDLARIDSLSRRIAAVDGSASPERLYLKTQAAAWLTLAREQYRRNDRSGLVETAFTRASDVARRLKAGGKSLGSLPANVPGAPVLRAELRALADSLRRSDALRCVAEPLARFEVELVRAGHEKVVCRPEDPHPRADGLDRAASELRVMAADCAPRPVAIAAAPPPPVPEPTPTPIPEPTPEMIEQLTGLNNVHFDLNAETISAASAVVLDSVAALLQRAPGIRAALIGHTDPRGSAAYNLALGRRRALMVREYLANAGIDTSRLSIESFGKNSLTARGTSVREYALNRRVEIQYAAPGGVLLETHHQERDLQIERAKLPTHSPAPRKTGQAKPSAHSPAPRKPQHGSPAVHRPAAPPPAPSIHQPAKPAAPKAGGGKSTPAKKNVSAAKSHPNPKPDKP